MIPYLVAAGAVALLLMFTKKVTPEKNPDQLAEELLQVHNDTLIDKKTGDFASVMMRPSPNKASRGKTKVSMLVWHYTAGAGINGAISWLCDPAAKASAHFIIGRDGLIVQLVPCAEAAWHAGGGALENVNSKSIGVELVSPGIVTKGADGQWRTSQNAPWVPDAEPQQATLLYPNGKAITAWWVPYTQAQIAGMIALKSMLAGSIWRDCLNSQCGHEDIDPTRKSDPGPLFPWDVVSTYEQRKILHNTKVKGELYG
jgi:N-acetylmuramoyl-L-alanine amidase